MIWCVHFIRISPLDYCTPLMYLPQETMGGFEAEDEKEAWNKFLSTIPEDKREWYQQTYEPEVQHG